MMEKRIVLNVSEELHKDFKLHCVASDTTMTECIKGFMERTAYPEQQERNEER